LKLSSLKTDSLKKDSLKSNILQNDSKLINRPANPVAQASVPVPGEKEWILTSPFGKGRLRGFLTGKRGRATKN
jgi:hypothetical protein